MTGEAISPLGTYGLSTDGAYSSYPTYLSMMDPTGMSSMYGGMGTMMNPSFMGMTNPSIMGMNGMYGMNGMMNPMFGMAYMQEATQQMQERMEKRSAKHDLEMHGILTNNDVIAHNETFEQQCLNILRNSSNAQMLNVLKAQVDSGNSNGIVDTYKNLELTVGETCEHLLKQSGYNENPQLQIRQLINNWYAIENGVSFEDDVKAHCDGALGTGFYNALRPGNNDITAEEVLSKCLGITEKGKESKKSQEFVGGLGGRIVGAAESALIGTVVVGSGATTVGLLAAPIAGIKSGKLGLKTFGKVAKCGWKFAPVVGAALGLVNLISPGCISKLIGSVSDRYWAASPSS